MTRRRVARFKGVSLGSTDESRSKTDLEPFPRTRAARIRGLLSSGRTQTADDEWKAAREEVGNWIDTELGGVGAVFDLLELSDLLPPSFFELSLPDLGKNINAASEATE